MHVDVSGALTITETQDFDIILCRHAHSMANHSFKHRSSNDTSLGGAITVSVNVMLLHSYHRETKQKTVSISPNSLSIYMSWTDPFLALWFCITRHLKPAVPMRHLSSCVLFMIHSIIFHRAPRCRDA